MVKIHKDHLLISIMLYVALGASLRAQQPTISKISFTGNEHTRDYIINREIQHSLGVLLDSSVVEADRERLENLQLFSMVHWQVYPQEDGTVEVRYFLIETWRFLPGLSPVYDEKTGWSVSGLLIINNFRGRNQNLQVAGIIGGISSYSLSFYDPWIAGDHLSLRTEYRNERIRHFYLPYDQRLLAADLQIGKDFHYRHKLRAKIRVEQKGFYTADSLHAQFEYLLPGFTYIYDSRNLYSDPYSGGSYTSAVTVGFSGTNPDRRYISFSGSCSWFHRIAGKKHKLVLGLNLRENFRFGYQNNLFDRYLGGAYTVRGWTPPDRNTYAAEENTFRFGYQSITAAVELRQTLVPKFVTALGNESGLILVLFLDGGIIDDTIKALWNRKPLYGAGIGIRIPSPMVGQLRLDYGWGFYAGEIVDNQFHLAFGHTF